MDAAFAVIERREAILTEAAAFVLDLGVASIMPGASFQVRIAIMYPT